MASAIRCATSSVVPTSARTRARPSNDSARSRSIRADSSAAAVSIDAVANDANAVSIRTSPSLNTVSGWLKTTRFP